MTGEPTISNHGSSTTKYYFVDESGDPTLFDSKGRANVGQSNSLFIILGKLDVAAPERLCVEMEQLRRSLLEDPYFRDVPSFDPSRKKIASAFHAKDDLPEIRRTVFQLLRGHDVRFYAVVRDKREILREVIEKHQHCQRFALPGGQQKYRYQPNQLYDHLVRRLFKDRLHKDDQYRICFATRGKSDRTAALEAALKQAKVNFQRKWKIAGLGPIEVTACPASAEPCLQAADYFLWALKRAYVERESRYLGFLWDKIALVHDVDDCRNAPYGVYYSQTNRLEVEKLKTS